ncbi:ATP-binding protein [soil metagenome]
MRIRLVHQLSLLLLATVVLAVAAMAAVVAWNLRAGFSDYLRAQDAQMLDRLVVLAERDLAQGGGPSDDGQGWGPVLRNWLDEMAEANGAIRAPRFARPPPQPGFDRPPRPPPPPPLGPPADPSNFGPRLVLLDAAARQPLAGRAETLREPGLLRAVKRDAVTLLHLRLAERAGPAEGVDAAFLQRQYGGLAVVAGVVIALALLAARLTAARWVKPLHSAQAAARRIAQGELDVRIAAPPRQDELGALTDDINAMADALQRLESSRRRWIAELSHELRTPLAVLRGELEVLMDGIRPLDRTALVSLQDEVARLSRLTDDFHTLAHSDLRALPCRFAPVAIAPLLAEALNRVRGRAAGLSLKADFATDLPSADWDGERIAQLLANLLENSLRYTDAPGQVNLSVRRQGEGVLIGLDDSAPGVPPEALAHLFEPLYRVEVSRSRHTGGSGLGLAIALAIAQSHAGWLQAEASALGGLSMKCWLPLKP